MTFNWIAGLAAGFSTMFFLLWMWAVTELALRRRDPAAALVACFGFFLIAFLIVGFTTG